MYRERLCCIRIFPEGIKTQPRWLHRLCFLPALGSTVLEKCERLGERECQHHKDLQGVEWREITVGYFGAQTAIHFTQALKWNFMERNRASCCSSWLAGELPAAISVLQSDYTIPELHGSERLHIHHHLLSAAQLRGFERLDPAHREGQEAGKQLAALQAVQWLRGLLFSQAMQIQETPGGTAAITGLSRSHVKSKQSQLRYADTFLLLQLANVDVATRPSLFSESQSRCGYSSLLLLCSSVWASPWVTGHPWFWSPQCPNVVWSWQMWQKGRIQ